MKEKWMKWKENVTDFFKSRSKKQLGILAGSILIVLMIIIGVIFLTTRTNFVPLYNNLSLQEVNQIKTELDARGIPYELEDGGTSVLVPEDQVDGLLVDLAGQGIPDSGNIDYSFFSENSSWGVTDNEFDMMRLDAMQTELANLIKGIDGIQEAEVMINMPETPVFANETQQEASASIVINTEPGYQFEENQINALYHLVSKAVPNLPEENIVIMNQYFEYFDREGSSQYANQGSHEYQQSVKQDVEKDIQRRLQQMLGAVVGMDNVIVSVTADIDFTQENRTEDLVEPVDIENMEGLPVSIEAIQESYGGDAEAGGVAGAGEEDIANYPAAEEAGEGDYELDKETINYEFNRIRKEIVESPYKIRDLGIQVVVDNVKNASEEEVEYLTLQEQTNVEEGIASILDSIISTTIHADYEEETDADPEEKMSIVFQEFNAQDQEETGPQIPAWVYVAGAILLLLIIGLIIYYIRNRNAEDEYEEIIEYVDDHPEQVPDIEKPKESEEVVKRKQLEKLAKEKPEEFAKLLRSWIGED